MNGGGEKTWKGEEKHSGRPVCRERGEVQPRWWNVRKRKCHCHASTRRPKKKKRRVGFYERGDRGGGKKKKETKKKKKNPPATWRYAYTYIYIKRRKLSTILRLVSC